MSDLKYRPGQGVVDTPERRAAELDSLLDEALGNTFPASDPVSELRISFPGAEASTASPPVRYETETPSEAPR
jgi:hypothetical protein